MTNIQPHFFLQKFRTVLGREISIEKILINRMLAPGSSVGKMQEADKQEKLVPTLRCTCPACAPEGQSPGAQVLPPSCGCPGCNERLRLNPPDEKSVAKKYSGEGFACQKFFLQSQQPFMRGINLQRRNNIPAPIGSPLFKMLLGLLGADDTTLAECSLSPFLVDPNKAPLVKAYTTVLREHLIAIAEERLRGMELAAIIRHCSPLLLIYIGAKICPELTSSASLIARRLPFCISSEQCEILHMFLPKLIKRWTLQEMLGTSLAEFLQRHPYGLVELPVMCAELELTDSFANGNAQVLCQELELKCAQNPDFNDRCIQMLKVRFQLPQSARFFTLRELDAALKQFKRALSPNAALAWPQEEHPAARAAAAVAAVLADQ